jgi:hypothetical protein
MRGKHAIEFALDPVDAYPVWDKIVARKAVPLFSITDSQSKVFDWRYIDAGLIFPFLCAFFPVFFQELWRWERSFE